MIQRIENLKYGKIEYSLLVWSKEEWPNVRAEVRQSNFYTDTLIMRDEGATWEDYETPVSEIKKAGIDLDTIDGFAEFHHI